MSKKEEANGPNSYRLSISNFLTIESLELDLSPGVQGFVGDNAAGKTNVLTALQSILSGKHDTKLIKDGKKRSEVRLEELQDDRVVAHVARIQTENNSRLEGNGLSGTTPKKWLSSLLDEIAINPLSLISGDPVKYLKQHLPIKIEQSEVIKVPTVKVDFNLEANSFFECSRVSDDIGVARREQYQISRHNMEVADELRKNLPLLPDEPSMSKIELEDKRAFVRAKGLQIDEHNKARDEIEIELDEIKEEKESFDTRIEEDDKRCEFLDQDQVKNNQRMKDEIAEIEIKYKKLNSETEAKKSALKQRMETDKESIDGLRKRYKDKFIKLESMPEMSKEEISREKAEIELEITNVNSFEELKKRHEQLAEKVSIYDKSKELYQHLDDSFKYYAYTLPKKLINRANLPVKGLEFRDEELYVEERHIERLSTAERHLIAVKLAVALAKIKGHVCVCLDGVECFTEENRDKLMKEITDTGLRVIYTRHGDKKYSHETEVSKKHSSSVLS